MMSPEMIEVVRQLRSFQNKADAYLERLPLDVRSAFFDNDYVNCLNGSLNLLVNNLFGDSAEAVSWFLYDFVPGASEGPHCVDQHGREWFYETDEDYYAYLATEV